MGRVPESGRVRTSGAPAAVPSSSSSLCFMGGHVHVSLVSFLGSQGAAGSPLKLFLGYKYRPEKPSQEVSKPLIFLFLFGQMVL